VITDAVSSQKWPGEAKVHVSLVNWVKQPDAPVAGYSLDGLDVEGITPSLTAAGEEEWTPVALGANKGKCFQGPIPIGSGFVVEADIAAHLIADASHPYADVVRPYLVGDDLTKRIDQSPSRWTIDFGLRTLEEATRYPQALAIVRRDVKPFRENSNRKFYRDHWWIFGEPRMAMRKAIAPLARYATIGRVGKRVNATWQDARTCPSDLVMVFAIDEDYSMGILLSRAHDAWAWAQSSTLKGDLRYTPTTVFATFPFPAPTDAQREKIAAASAALYERRSALCVEHNLGLTKLYNLMDEGGFQDLKKLHKDLDEAVTEAYGWPRSVAQDKAELVRRLRDLNREITEGKRPYAPFTTTPRE